MSIEYDLKQKIDRIINYAYRDSDNPNKERFTWFHLKVYVKNFKSLSGVYVVKTHEIRIYDVLALEANNISTLLHEVAHHIDWVMRGTTDHQRPFYKVYQTLLYAALDLGYTSVSNLKKMDHRNTDYTKVMKILNRYVPTEYSRPDHELFQIKVSQGYALKETLKKNKYFYNGLSKTWDKSDLSMEQVKNERSLLVHVFHVNPESIQVVSMNAFNFHDGHPNEKRKPKESYKTIDYQKAKVVHLTYNKKGCRYDR